MKFKRFTSNPAISGLKFCDDQTLSHVHFFSIYPWQGNIRPVLYTRRGTPYIEYFGTKWSVKDLFMRVEKEVK